MNSIALAVIGMTLTILCGCSSIRINSAIETWKVAAADPVSAVGHGVLLNSTGVEVDVAATPQFAIEAQRYYLKDLYLRANVQQRSELIAKHRSLYRGPSLSKQEQIVMNSALIAWMINTVKPDDAASLAIRNSILRSGIVPSQALLERLKQEGLPDL